MQKVHYAEVKIVGPEQIRTYRSKCGLDDVLDRWWTVNPELVTCQRCRDRHLPSGWIGNISHP